MLQTGDTVRFLRGCCGIPRGAVREVTKVLPDGTVVLKDTVTLYGCLSLDIGMYLYGPSAIRNYREGIVWVRHVQ